MTPGARVAAAIGILDRIASGAVAEQALTNWGRSSRFAGSKDRQAVRDHVFDVLRRWRSTAALGGSDTGRGRMIGLFRSQGADLTALFNGEGHAPSPLSLEEIEAGSVARGPEALDCPDWLYPAFQQSLGPDADAVLTSLQSRAPVFLRVNLARSTREQVAATLAADEILTRPVPDVQSALEVIQNERKVALHPVYLEGLAELQDAASQAACARVGLAPGARVLDYCAGGGGKALALAARGAEVTAHDIDPRRMKYIGPRAQRAGVRIEIKPQLSESLLFDLVFCDAPCSGSGTWRRAPEAKWALTPQRLAELQGIQAAVLDKAARHVAPGGRLAYATCSVLREENQDVIADFLNRTPGVSLIRETQWLPGAQGDGFFLAEIGYVGEQQPKVAII